MMPFFHGATGFESALDEPTRRAILALARRVAVLEASVGGGGIGLTGVWQWNVNAGAVPGGAQVTSDTGDAAAASWLRFAEFDKANFDWSVVAMMLTTSSTIAAQQTMNAANRAVFSVTGAPSDGGSYIQVPVSPITVSGTNASAWQDVTILFSI